MVNTWVENFILCSKTNENKWTLGSRAEATALKHKKTSVARIQARRHAFESHSATAPAVLWVATSLGPRWPLALAGSSMIFSLGCAICVGVGPEHHNPRRRRRNSGKRAGRWAHKLLAPSCSPAQKRAEMSRGRFLRVFLRDVSIVYTWCN